MYGAVPAVIAQESSSNLVFRLGTFDRSSGEFVQSMVRSPVKVDAGGKSAASEWYAAQPAQTVGAGAEHASIASAPRTIDFSIGALPATAYRLHIAVLIEGTGVPALRVTINGKHGVFYLHPELDFGVGDQNDPSDFSHADVVFTFPGSYLHAGKNTIGLQAIEETETPGATLNYDAIELDHDTHGLDSESASATVNPSIYYVEDRGLLEELIDVIVRHADTTAMDDALDLQLAGTHYHQRFRSEQEFGEEKCEFRVPEFSAHTEVQLNWTIGGLRHASQQFIDPKKKWTVFVVPHIHLDVGYSDYQAKVAAVQSRAIDEALDMAAHHPGFSYSLDGEWPLEQFLKSRSPADQERAIAAIQKGQLFVPAEYANLLTGFATAETLIRSLYASADLSRIHDLPFDYAVITDVPSYSWSYASILASAGIKDFIAGMNGRNVRAPVLMWGHLNETSPIWWEGPDGQKVLFWYARGYQQMRSLFGLPPVIASGSQTLPLFLQQYERESYRANAAIVYGTQQENTDLFSQQAELAEQWNHIYVYPRLQYAGFYEALNEIAKQFRGDIPTIRGDGGPYWEDGAASDAYYGIMERSNESRGPSAEKLQTIMSLVNPRLAPDKPDLDRMWTSMILMDEHTWTSSNSVRDPKSTEAAKQLAVKNLYATDARALSDWLVRESMANLADSIPVDKDALIVFNTLNWTRGGMVTIDLTKGDEIVDSSTGQVVPFEVLGDGVRFRHVRFIASNVPAMGYRTFLFRPETKLPEQAKSAHTTTLESPYYRVELDGATGAIRSIYDKDLKRELVNLNSSYRFGEYLYVTGGDQAPNSILNYVSVYPKPVLAVHPAQQGQLLSVTKAPYGWVAHMRSASTNTPAIETEVRLYNDEKKIELVEEVTKTKVETKEAVYFAFPFAMSDPQFQYEIQNGAVDPAKDMYPGAGEEWFSVQHWVSVQQDGVSATVMPLDGSLVTLGDINRGAWPKTFGDRKGTIFSYVMNNYWDTNWPASQGGPFRFRYIITSAVATDRAQLSHLGWEEVTPLEKDAITSQDKASLQPRPLDRSAASFIDVPDNDLLLETWKPAENGDGTILRFLDFGGTARTVKVDIPILRINQVWLCDAVERNKERLALDGTSGFRLSVHPYSITTVRVTGTDLLPAPEF
jgi:alpha-mannosidase